MNKEFVSDLEFEDEYFAQLIRCDELGAKIIDIEIPLLPENYFFYSAKDIQGKNKVSFFDQEIKVFADTIIEYSGQAVGILIGTHKRELKKISALFNVKTNSFNKSKTPFSFEEESKNYFDYPTIASEHLTSKDNSSIENIFEKSPNVVYSTCAISKKHHFYSEPICIKTNWVEKKLNIHLVTQWPFNVLNNISEVLNISKDKINVIMQKETEILDGKIWLPSLLATQVAVAANLSKKNISIEFTRKDDFLYSTKSPSILIQHKSAISKMGKILAMSISIIVDSGNFNPFIHQMLKQMVVCSAGMYYLPNFEINATAIKTDSGLTDLFMGWGDSFVTTALEKHINEIINRFSLCPIQFRLENAIRVGQDFIFGVTKKKDFLFQNLVKAICNTSDFYRKYHAYRVLNKNRKNRYDGKWRGIGIATGFQYNGSNILIKSGMNYKVEMTLTKKNQVRVKAEPTTLTLKKILKKQIAKELDLEEDAVLFMGGSTDDMIFTGASTASSGFIIIPELISRCCTGIKNQRFRKALPITVNRVYSVSKKKDWDSKILHGYPCVSVTPGACAIELELEPSTYKIKVKNIWLACYPGKIYSKKDAVRSLHKSITTVLSNISVEKIDVKDLHSPNYKMITTGEIPNINVFLLDNDLKPKGIGELAGGLVPAAYISALNQILINYKQIDSIPIFTDDIFKAMEGQNFIKGDEEENED